MFCNNCGTKLEEDALFCPNCGSRVESMAVLADEDDKTVILSAEEPESVEERVSAEKPQPTEESGNVVENKKAVENETVVNSENIEGNENTVESENAEENDTQKDIVGNQEERKNETIEAVEISPTGVVETNAAVVVPSEAQKKFCPNCGTANNINDLFCQECGMFFGNAEEKMGKGMDPKAKKGGKALKIAIPAVIVIALLAVLICVVRLFIQSSGNDKDFIVYIKENELFMAKSGKFEPMQIGGKIYEDKEDAQTHSYYVGVSYSPDYSYVYYPKNLETDEYTYDLYSKKLGSKNAEEEKIDSDVLSYQVIDNDRIAYIKDSTDRKLYLYDGKDSEKITSDAAWMTVSEDGKYILWRSNDGDNKLYVQDTDMKEDKKKLDSDISYLRAYSDDLKTIVYEKDENLYVLKNMEEKEKIASDVMASSVYGVNGNLQIYYIKEGDMIDLSVYDLIEDDYLSQDQNMQEPQIEDYQTVTYVNDFFGSREKIETDDAYYRELEKYEEKETRDYLREELKNEQMVYTPSRSIYYYNAKDDESVKILEFTKLVGESLSLETDTALMYLWNSDLDNMEKIKLSTLLEEDDEELEELFEEKLLNSTQLLFLKGEEVLEVDEEDIDYKKLSDIDVWVNEKMNTLYIGYDFYNPESDRSHSELYSYAYQSEDAKLAMLCDEFDSMISWNTSEGIYYTNEEDDLYCNDMKIDSDVYASSVRIQENGSVLYLTDIDDNYEEGTLKIYQAGETKKIADDVAIYTYGVFDQNKIAFLTDYNFNKHRGDLEVYNGKKVIRIDSDVTSVIY